MSLNQRGGYTNTGTLYDPIWSSNNHSGTTDSQGIPDYLLTKKEKKSNAQTASAGNIDATKTTTGSALPTGSAKLMKVSGTPIKDMLEKNALSQDPNQINGPTKVWSDKLEQMATGNFDSSDPSYRWRFEQGQQALERSQASKGLLGSGNAAIELQDYGQNQASTEYQAQFTRILEGMKGIENVYDTQQQRLLKLAGIELDKRGQDLNYNSNINGQNLGYASTTRGQSLDYKASINGQKLNYDAAIQTGNLDYSAKMKTLRQDKSQWQDQLTMNNLYQRGIADGLNSGGN